MSDEEPSIKTAYLNLDFPVPTREWEGVFDAWLQGDAQKFAEMLQEELGKDAKAKEVARERKRKREEALFAGVCDREAQASDQKGEKKRKYVPEESPTKAAKRRKLAASLSSPPKSKPAVKGKTKAIAPISTSSPLHRWKSLHAPSGILLRIPARTKPPLRKFLVPEVYITTSVPDKKIISTDGYTRPALTRAPTWTKKAAPKTKAKGKAAHDVGQHSRMDKQQTHIRPQEDHTPGIECDSSDLTDESNELPNSFVRTVQYGLRG
jgi:NAD-dependent histone deacetylase SIR2